MTKKKDMTKVLRKLLQNETFVLAPGAYDCLSAKMIEAAGFKMVYSGGFVNEGANMGFLDLGMQTMTELIAHCSKMARAVNIPIFCDSDTGGGNAFCVRHTIEEWIRVGVGGVYIEDTDDRVFSKHCPGWEELGGYTRQLLPLEVSLGKLKAAIDMRNELDPDFVIVARCDADVTGSYDTLVKRCNAYVDAGADQVFPITWMLRKGKSTDEMKEIFYSLPRDVKAPLGLQTTGDPREAKKAGYKMCKTPIYLGTVAYYALKDAIEELKITNSIDAYFEKHNIKKPWALTHSREYWEMFGLDKMQELEKMYMPKGLYVPQK